MSPFSIDRLLTVDPRSMMTSLFHKPPAGRNIFPKGWVTTQEQGKFVTFLAPFYTAACQTGLRGEFLDKVYRLWFDRFPVTVESEDPDDLEYAIAAQKKVTTSSLTIIYANAVF